MEAYGIIYRHGKNDFELWQLDLPEEAMEKIETILDEFRNRGCSVRGTAEEIAEEIGDEPE